jgi:serine/threonine protein kinase
MKTTNHHFVTWTNEDLLKEFNHHSDFTTQLDRINKVYNTVPHPLHIEYGYVNNNPNAPSSCVITRLGYKLTRDNVNRFLLTKAEVMNQVLRGLEELHAIGFGHCDLCIANFFIDRNGTVFLDDLEYLSPPHKTRLPNGANESEVGNALPLDYITIPRLLQTRFK